MVPAVGRDGVLLPAQPRHRHRPACRSSPTAAALVELLEASEVEQRRCARARHQQHGLARLRSGIRGPRAARRRGTRPRGAHRAPPSAAGGREVRVRVEPSPELFAGPLVPLAWVSPGAVEIEVGPGPAVPDRVAIGVSPEPQHASFPLGFWAGVSVCRGYRGDDAHGAPQARPLREVADAVDRMSLAGRVGALPDACVARPRSAPDRSLQPPSPAHCRLIKARMALIGASRNDLSPTPRRLRLRAELIADAGRARQGRARPRR